MAENKRFERIYANVDVFCRDHNAKGISQLIENEDYDKIVDLLNHLHEENKELQERNNRQCKQLDDLFKLIEEKDWRALTDILDDFKRNDEQLQREWKCYE